MRISRIVSRDNRLKPPIRERIPPNKMRDGRLAPPLAKVPIYNEQLRIPRDPHRDGRLKPPLKSC